MSALDYQAALATELHQEYQALFCDSFGFEDAAKEFRTGGRTNGVQLTRLQQALSATGLTLVPQEMA